MLRLADVGEKNRIATLYLREGGRVAAVARGARGSSRRFGGGLDHFVRARFTFARTRTGLPVLNELSIVEPYEGLRGDVLAYAAASFVTELVLETTAEHDPSPRAYDWLVTCLGQTCAAPFDTVLAFQLGWFQCLGVLPPLDPEGLREAGFPLLSAEERDGANALVAFRSVSPDSRRAVGRLTKALRERVLTRPMKSEAFLRELL